MKYNLLDNTGTSVVEYNYQPFGETEILGTKAQELENTYQFNAESTDALTGLQYLRARYYDSKTGRFTSQDSYRGEITEPLSRNLYLYTKNDPVNYVDPSGHIFEAIMQMADTAKKLYQKASEEAIQKIETSNFIPSVMKTALKTAINTQVSKTINKYENRKSTTKPTIETVIENIKKNEPASPSRQAAINEKVEYAKALEQKIKKCRSLNTMEANRIAEELEYQMRLLCDDNLDRVDVQKSAERITSIVMESVQSKMKESSDKGFSAAVGFVSTLALDTLEFWGGITTAAGYLITFQNPIEGYGKFREVIVDPLRETIEENVPDKEAYEVGTGVAIGFEMFEAGKGIVKLTTTGGKKLVSIFKGEAKLSSPIKASIGKVKTNSLSEAPTAGTIMSSSENLSSLGAEKSTTKLYRVMSQAEYDSVIKNNKFITYDRAMEEKWFAMTTEDASKWGRVFYPDGNYKMIEIEVNNNSLANMYYNSYLDNIGPAYCGSVDLINNFIQTIREVK